jgi:succinyl-CoA synthetase beta subunit
MNLHEYQAKELFLQQQIPTPSFRLIANPWEAYEAAQEIGGETWVVKAQIHAGGRGKAGGVKLCRTLEQVHEAATAMYGATLVTPQTGPGGKQVRKMIVSAAVDIAREYYLAMLVDRGAKSVAVMASREGGVEIEKVAAESPDKISLQRIDLLAGMPAFVTRNVALALGLEGPQAKECAALVAKLFRLFAEKDCALIEINP